MIMVISSHIKDLIIGILANALLYLTMKLVVTYDMIDDMCSVNMFPKK